MGDTKKGLERPRVCLLIDGKLVLSTFAMVALVDELGKQAGEGMKETQHESLSPAKTLTLKKRNNKPVLIVMNDEYRKNPFDDDDDDDASNDSESVFSNSSSNSSSSSNG